MLKTCITWRGDKYKHFRIQIYIFVGVIKNVGFDHFFYTNSENFYVKGVGNFFLNVIFFYFFLLFYKFCNVNVLFY